MILTGTKRSDAASHCSVAAAAGLKYKNTRLPGGGSERLHFPVMTGYVEPGNREHFKWSTEIKNPDCSKNQDAKSPVGHDLSENMRVR